MLNLKNPKWINQTLLAYQSLDQVPDHIFDSIKKRLKFVISDKPEITVCIAAWNEELNILKCLDSLSWSVSKVPFDIVVVNNNSTDRTQLVLDRLGVQSYMQPIQGCGAARELGQQKAKGTYILLGDADCLYPQTWINHMYKNLRKKRVVAAYSKHAFIGDDVVPRWQYGLYELGKRAILETRNIKRPYLNAYGMSLGYIKELGLKEGFVNRNIRGEDGRLCFDLMKYGKIKFVRSRKTVVWTKERNFAADGGFSGAVQKRILLELVRFREYFKKPPAHDTKTSENLDLSSDEYKKMLKSKLNISGKKKDSIPDSTKSTFPPKNTLSLNKGSK